MLKFQVSGTDSTGMRTTLTVEAESARDAHTRMTELGYIDITLHTDDAMAAAVLSMPGKDVDETFITAQDMVQLRCLSRSGYFLFLIRKMYSQGRIGWVLAIGAVAYSLWQHGTLAWYGWIGFVYLAFPLVIAAWTTLTGMTLVYEALLEACYWGRWKEVLDRSAKLRGHVPDFELDVRVATALAGLGRLDEGLAIVAQHQGTDGLPDWMYVARLAEIYQIAGLHEEALRCQRESYEAAPDNPTVLLDYAMGLLKSQTNTELAASLLRKVEEQPLSDMLQLFLPFAKGLLALNTRDHREAVELFQQTEKDLAPLAPGSAPVRGVIDMIRAYRAIGLAKLGERGEAGKLFNVVRPRLTALRSERILEQYEKALAG